MKDRENVYYEIKCLYCDKPLTGLLSNTAYVKCPYCGHIFSLYQILSYNMWLAENHKANKVAEKPSIFEDILQNYEDDNNSAITVPFTFDSIFEELKPKEKQTLTEDIHEICSNQASIIKIQYNCLIKVGFTKDEAFLLLQKMVENGLGGY